MTDSAPVPTDPVPPPLWRRLLAVWIVRGRAVWDVVIAPTLSLRTLVLGGAAFFLLARDFTAAKSFLFSLGLVAAVLACLHWYRKTQQPYLDRQKLIESANFGNMAAAVVYCATVAFDIAIVLFFVFAGLR